MALDPLASSARLSGGRGYVVTVTFKVYDMTVSRPPTGLGLYLNQARLEGNLCDVKLVLDGGLELDAHRTVLAARSPVLNKMLTGDFKEARESRVRLHLDHTPTAACQTAIAKFVEYVYTDEIADWENCELELLKLADMYMVPELRLDTELRLWSCDALRALEVLHAAGLGDFIGRKLRRRLTAIVVHNIADLTRDLAGSVLWNEFEKTYPALVDSMFSYAAKPSDGGFQLLICKELKAFISPKFFAFWQNGNNNGNQP
ncbi:kelch-like protein 21, partial [Frankliniella occidentalis]|uniref:Kelch-like protein 21 n=1 Tax=Frankliniella occidentalis TaxID=133901 RepID=A0A9C6XD34_FRAOC